MSECPRLQITLSQSLVSAWRTVLVARAFQVAVRYTSMLLVRNFTPCVSLQHVHVGGDGFVTCQKIS